VHGTVAVRPDPWAYLVVAVVAATVTTVLVPVFRHLSFRIGAVAQPDERRVHERPTALLGGGAMYAGFLAAFAVAWASGWFQTVFQSNTEPIGVLLAASLCYFLGLLDDVRDISAPAKTAGLVLSGSTLFFSGVSILWFIVPFGSPLVLSPDLSFLITVVWLLGMANAVNFIDGLDGLAAGIVAIGAGAFLLYGLRLGSDDVGLLLAGNIGPLIAAVVLGMCVGFLPWNVNPARIFMGDSGALMLGGLMAAATMAVGGRTQDPFSGQTFFFYAPLVIPLLILGVPILDTAFAILRRASRRQGLATPDKDHLHHRLMRLGHGQRRSVAILWAWTALLSGLVLFPTYSGQGDAVVPIGVAGLCLLLYTVLHPGVVRERRARRGAERDAARAEHPSSAPQPVEASAPVTPRSNGTPIGSRPVTPPSPARAPK
jgi:UDP-GlcNAc:undecaprenyl-phosphate/decaprenyl-phosphate GlcNAc-1-phosphate transferase